MRRMIANTVHSVASDLLPVIDTVRPTEEPIHDTVKRVLGATVLLLVSFPAANKDGWTIPFTLQLSDTIGIYIRSRATKTVLETPVTRDS